MIPKCKGRGWKVALLDPGCPDFIKDCLKIHPLLGRRMAFDKLSRRKRTLLAPPKNDFNAYTRLALALTRRAEGKDPLADNPNDYVVVSKKQREVRTRILAAADKLGFVTPAIKEPLYKKENKDVVEEQQPEPFMPPAAASAKRQREEIEEEEEANTKVKISKKITTTTTTTQTTEIELTVSDSELAAFMASMLDDPGYFPMDDTFGLPQ
jgi:hypothetical protein